MPNNVLILEYDCYSEHENKFWDLTGFPFLDTWFYSAVPKLDLMHSGHFVPTGE